jgi:purine-binding chemotaxis protein CheW
MHKDRSSKLLIFSSDNKHYAIHAENIERVLSIVETTSIPNSPFILFGIFNLEGKTLPVISLRRLFSLDEKIIELEDMLIVIHIGERLISLLTDSVLGIFECPKDETTDTDELFPGLVPIEIVKWEEMLLPVIDVEKLIDEEIFHHIAAHNETDDKEISYV